MKLNLAPFGFMDGVIDLYGSKARDRELVTTKPCSLRGKDWDKRKSRSKIARASRKRNRK